MKNKNGKWKVKNDKIGWRAKGIKERRKKKDQKKNRRNEAHKATLISPQKSNKKIE